MQSIDEIYRAHASMVYRYLLSRTGDAGLAEELTQETFYLAVKGIDRFDGSCRISTWLIAIAKNALRTYRRKNPETEPLPEAANEAPSPEAVVGADEERIELMKKLRTLPEDVREVMYMRLFGDFSFQQIGQIMERTENWARVTYFRGREKLKKELENE